MLGSRLAVLSVFLVGSSLQGSLYENVTEFCSKVPSAAEIQGYVSDTCFDHPDVFTRPLVKMRSCCDQDEGEAKECLDLLAKEDQLLRRAFLQWDPPNPLSDYVTQIINCKSTFDKIPRPTPDEFVIDPMRSLQTSCLDESDPSDDCKELAARNTTYESYESICVYDDKEYDSWHQEPKFRSVHYRCFKESKILNRVWQGFTDDALALDECCKYDAYGTSVDVENFNWIVIYKDQLGESLEDTPEFKKMQDEYLYYKAKGFADLSRKLVEVFIPELCKNPTLEGLPKAMKCLQTPVMMNHLNYQPIDQDKAIVESCCGDRVFSSSDYEVVEEVMDCLDEKDLLADMYPLSGNYFRNLLRRKSHYQWDCISEDALNEKKFTPDQYRMSNEEQEEYWEELDYKNFKPFFKGNFSQPDFMITPENFHFFLRNMSDGVWADRTCEACKLGERFGKAAYTQPAAMCPGLVYRHFYRPIQHETTCPDAEGRFHKVQVAHYCCLYAAFTKYSYAAFDPATCPDVSDVDATVFQD